MYYIIFNPKEQMLTWTRDIGYVCLLYTNYPHLKK